MCAAVRNILSFFGTLIEDGGVFFSISTSHFGKNVETGGCSRDEVRRLTFKEDVDV